MKKLLMLCLTAITLLGLYGCNNQSTSVEPEDEVISAARLGAVASGQLSGSAVTPVSVSALPTTIQDYIAKNYAGFTARKAAKDADGNYIVVVENSSREHKALLFGADGSFKQELAFMKGNGPDRGRNRPGGPSDRGPNSFTSVDVASLPSAITSYVTSKYASSTISGAAQNAEKLFVVFVKTTDGRVVLEFNADGSFKQEVQRPGRGRGGLTEVATADLPKAITDYISQTYAGSTVKKAAKSSVDGGYIVWITKADGTNVGLSFGADGAFKQELKCTKNQKPTT